MSDNVTLPGDLSVVATDQVADGSHIQRIKIDLGGDGLSVPVVGAVPVAGDFYQATQPVSVAGTITVSGALTDSELRSSAVPVSLAVAPTTPVTGVFWQGTQPVSGPVTDDQLRATPVSVSMATAPTTPVTGIFWQATQPVSGLVSVSNMVAQGLTDAQLRATQIATAPTGKSAPYWPSYGVPTSISSQGQMIDTGGALITRGAVLTDEGTFRANFANTSLAVAVGACTVLGNVVTGAGFDVSDVHLKDYFKFDADAESAWVQIDSIDSATQITLVSDYSGSSTGAASRALMRPMTGAGGSITVVSGQCVMTSGTTSGSRTILSRVVDYAPLVYRQRLQVSQRVANQNLRIGFSEASPTPRWFARFRLNGADAATNVTCESGRNPTQQPSAAETESTEIIVPNGKSTFAMAEYRIEQLVETVRFFIDGVLVAEHSKSLPSAYDVMVAGTLIENTDVPASSTTVTIDYVTSKNHNKIEIGVMSDSEKMLASQVPMQALNFNLTGVIPINTDLIVVDCSQLRTLSMQCTSMGATGVITPAWSNDRINWINATLLNETGASSTTFNTAVLRMTNVMARYFRLRLTTATTAGTTTLFVNGSQMAQPPIVAIQPVSGTVSVGTPSVVGLAAHSAVASGNPVQVGGVVAAAVSIAEVAGDVARLQITTGNQLNTKPYGLPETDWQFAGSAGGIINTVDVVLRAPGAAGVRNYCTSISVQNASATIATEVVVKDGATVIWRGYVGTSAILNSAVSVVFPTPLRGTAATALNVACITTGAAVYVNAQGYQAA